MVSIFIIGSILLNVKHCFFKTLLDDFGRASSFPSFQNYILAVCTIGTVVSVS